MSPDELDLSAFMPPGWEGKFPPCQIQVDQQGRLWHDGAAMIHPGILELIYQSVHLEEGVYFLQVGKQRCQLEVADTFFVVNRAELQGEQVLLTLNDASQEPLDPDTLSIGAGDVLYCQVKAGAFPARFLRSAYYQLTQWVEPQGEGFALRLGSRLYPLTKAD